MAYHGYLRFGDVELVNNQRAFNHAMNGISSVSLEVIQSIGWGQTNVWLGEPEPITPSITGAPWVDPTRNESYEFGGVMALDIQGLETTEIEQDIQQATGDGGHASPRRLPARVITVDCLLVAETSRGLQWGLRWLTRSLMSEDCQEDSGPRDLIFLESAPEYRQSEQDIDVQTRVAGITRMLSRVVVSQSPTIETLSGRSAARGDVGACTARVTFELTALVPRVWRNPVRLLASQDLSKGEPLSVSFTELDPDGSCPANCDADDGILVDPLSGPLWTLPRPVAPGADIGCQLIDSRRSIFTIPEGLIPLTGEMLPTVTLRSEGKEERHVRIRWARGVVTDDGAALDCQTVGEAMATYLPAESTLTLDGRSGTATAFTSAGAELDATPVMVGRGGGPWRAPVMRCGAPYSLVVDTDVDTALSIEVTGVTGEV